MLGVYRRKLMGNSTLASFVLAPLGGRKETLPLRQSIAVVWSRRWIVALVTAVTVAAALAAAVGSSRSYTSTAKVLVRAINLNPQAQAPASGGDNIATEQLLAHSLPVATLAAKLLAGEAKKAGPTARKAGPITPGALLANATVTAPTGTFILLISYTNSNPALAQAGAQAFAQSYLEYRQAEARQALATNTTSLERDIARAQSTIYAKQQIVANSPPNAPKAIAA